jgi:hypothetical protein
VGVELVRHHGRSRAEKAHDLMMMMMWSYFMVRLRAASWEERSVWLLDSQTNSFRRWSQR